MLTFNVFARRRRILSSILHRQSAKNSKFKSQKMWENQQTFARYLTVSVLEDCCWQRQCRSLKENQTLYEFLKAKHIYPAIYNISFLHFKRFLFFVIISKTFLPKNASKAKKYFTRSWVRLSQRGVTYVTRCLLLFWRRKVVGRTRLVSVLRRWRNWKRQSLCRVNRFRRIIRLRHHEV